MIIERNSYSSTDPIVLSKYAKIGLSNFYEAHPKVFLDRLSKGPPPQYRWLAWKVAISKLKKRGTGVYEEFLRDKVQSSRYKVDI